MIYGAITAIRIDSMTVALKTVFAQIVAAMHTFIVLAINSQRA